MSEKCPYCEAGIDWESLPAYEDETVTMTCEECGKTFRCRATLDYIYSKDCELNNEEHEWAHYFDDSKAEHCEKCGEIRARQL